MAIQHVHAYRFGYLKSDKWKTVRLEAIVRDKGICQFCGKEVGPSADAHHIFYPKSFWKTHVCHLKTLCRECHDYVHNNLPKSFPKPSEAFKAFHRLKGKLDGGKTKMAKRQAYLANPKCWLCRKSPEGMQPFKSDHPKLFQFSAFVCPGCWLQMEVAIAGSEKPFTILRSIRLKKAVDAAG